MTGIQYNSTYSVKMNMVDRVFISCLNCTIACRLIVHKYIVGKCGGNEINFILLPL